MRATQWILVIGLAALAFAATSAAAHESYDIGDGEYPVTVGDQNEPIYTYKWTNLDLILRDESGDPVALDEGDFEALDARLEAPGGEMLDRPLEGQYGEEGRYEFTEGHFYTQPGQYTLHLDGEIRGVNATGTYDLPGPRESMSDFGFPDEGVPTPLEQQTTLEKLDQANQENEQLRQRVDELETRLDQLEQDQSALATQQEELSEDANQAPGLGWAAGLATLAGVAVLGVRRHR
jgi:hypothetical protein